MTAASPTPEPGTERVLRSTTRNPRRRPRQSDPESLRTAPRRKRSKLNSDTFVPPQDGETDGATAVLPSTEGWHATARTQSERPSTTGLEIELAVRSGKKHSLKRTHRSGAGTTLVQNALYSIKALSSTPKNLTREGVSYRGRLCSSGHKALAVTHQHAYIWDYAAHVSTPRIFDVPFACKSDEPLPFGELVSSGPSNELGLVLISASSGRVTYYDSIERAVSLSLFHSKTTVATEGTLGTLFSSEFVIDVTSADSAGLIVTLSSGRIAHLLLRDASGKPRVHAQFLRSSDSASRGIFGSIKGLIGGAAWKRDVCAVQTRQLGQRGLKQILSMTERGECQFWDLDWTGQYEYKGTIDLQEMLYQEVVNTKEAELHGGIVAVMDFVITNEVGSPTGSGLTALPTGKPLSMMLLVQVSRHGARDYTIVELRIDGAIAELGRILPIVTYGSRSQVSNGVRPRIVLPQPGHTAFAMIGDAFILVAIPEVEQDSPDTQLDQSYVQAESFQDTLYLRQDKHLAFLGAVAEDSKSGDACCIAFVEGAGLIRILANDPTADVERIRLPVKTKIEAAVFYGAMQDNIFDFANIRALNHPTEDVERAALQISSQILSSETNLITVNPTNIEANLAYRAQALRALVTQVRDGDRDIDSSTRWKLMWDAERIAAGQKMWAAYESHLEVATRHNQGTVLDELTKWLYHEEQSPDEDLVRRFFLGGLDKLDRILPFAKTFVKEVCAQQRDANKLLGWVNEADDLWLTCLETVFTFRVENAKVFGIPADSIGVGVMTTAESYTGVPEPWTATGSMLKASADLVTYARRAAKNTFESPDQAGNETVYQQCQKIATENGRLVELCCMIFEERIRWTASRDTAKDKDFAQKLQLHYEQTRYEQCRELADLGQAEAGMRLAESFKDMTTLTEMVIGEQQYFLEALQEPDAQEQHDTIVSALEKIDLRITSYFDRFGDDWAEAFFSEGFSGGKAAALIGKAQTMWPEALTRYLRKEKDRAKLCWINDVQQERDYMHACEALNGAALGQETGLWAKKVELSLSKIAVLAAVEEGPLSGASAEEVAMQAARSDSELNLVDVQEKLYGLMKQDILHCIDEDAEVDEAMRKFGSRVGGFPALSQLFKNCLVKVVKHQACSIDELVDILSLFDSKDASSEEDEAAGSEYFLALVALNAVAKFIGQDRLDVLLQLIWKRCFVHDDWINITAGGKRSDQDITFMLRQTAPWRTLRGWFSSGISEGSECHVRVLTPSDCLGTACAAEDLRHRFGHEDILQPILNDIRVQDETLQQFVNDRKLDTWFGACKDDVIKVLEEDAEARASQDEKERLAEDFVANEDSELADLAHGNGNGHLLSVPNGITQYAYGESESGIGDSRVDDEDVPMS